MSQNPHRGTKSVLSLPAAVACAFLTITGARPASASPPHPHSVTVSKSTTMTPQQAARFRARMNAIPRLNRLSTRA